MTLFGPRCYPPRLCTWILVSAERLGKKGTTLLSHGIDLSPAHCRCVMSKGLCSRTGCRNTVLEGKDCSGDWNTLRAQAYPKELTRVLSDLSYERLLSSPLRG
eukprot:9049134-Pyramimonas_sp.AAC.1